MKRTQKIAIAKPNQRWHEKSLNAFTKIWIIIEMPETMHSHILCTHFRTPTTLSEIHTCAKLHSRASFGRERAKELKWNPSRIHGPYFINITLHVCILIKFSTFFSCASRSLAFSVLALLYILSCWNINSKLRRVFFCCCSLSLFALFVRVCVFMCFWNKPTHFVTKAIWSVEKWIRWHVFVCVFISNMKKKKHFDSNSVHFEYLNASIFSWQTLKISY